MDEMNDEVHQMHTIQSLCGNFDIKKYSKTDQENWKENGFHFKGYTSQKLHQKLVKKISVSRHLLIF